MWQLDDRLRRHDQEFEVDPIEDAKRRSRYRIAIAIVCTLVTLSIVAVKW